MEETNICQVTLNMDGSIKISGNRKACREALKDIDFKNDGGDI